MLAAGIRIRGRFEGLCFTYIIEREKKKKTGQESFLDPPPRMEIVIKNILLRLYRAPVFLLRILQSNTRCAAYCVHRVKYKISTE